MNKLHARSVLMALRSRRHNRIEGPLSPTDADITPFIVLPTDLDLNLHLNNGRYLQLADLGRLGWLMRTGILALAQSNGWRGVLGGTSIDFRRELRLFQRGAVETRLLGWDDRWIHLQHRFTAADGRLVADAVARAAFRHSGRWVAPDVIHEALGSFPRPCLPASPVPDQPLPDPVPATPALVPAGTPHRRRDVAVAHNNWHDAALAAEEESVPDVSEDAAQLTSPVRGAATILVVEDDPIARALVISGIERAGHIGIEAPDMASGWTMFTSLDVDLAIIDVNLPDGSGFALARRIRRRRPVGLIHLTSRAAAEDLVHGLESGADDYILKPVDLRELVARINAVLRRTRTSADPLILIGDWTLDLVRREFIDPAGAPVRLTRGEFDLLAALAQAGGITLSREYLVEVVSSLERGSGTRTIDVMVSRIRSKLATAPQPSPQIVTIKGEGYRLSGPNG